MEADSSNILLEMAEKQNIFERLMEKTLLFAWSPKELIDGYLF